MSDLQRSNLNVKILKISEVSFSSSVPENYSSKKFKDLTLNLDVNIKTRDNDRLEVLITCTLFNETKKENINLVTLKTLSLFEVENLNKYLKLDEKTKEIITLDDNLLYILLSNSTGTTRGMLAYRIASLPISNYVMPLINIREIVSNSKK